ncbi:hypothetical protein HY312_03450 [Candidatus Saccharibacteria bacterium]|nr:hypothetical protein [Candidatus Saccharibacteria bacterium]
MDIIVTLFNNIVTYVKNHFKKVMIITAVIIGLITLISVYQSFSFVTISVSTKSLPSDHNDPVARANSEYSSTKIGTSGLQFVPRSAKSITVSVGSGVASEVPLTVPWHRFTSVNVDLKSDLNATKVSYGSTLNTACATYNQEQDSLLSYDCQTPASLVKSNTPNNNYWGRTIVSSTKLSSYSPPASYMGGLIGLQKTYDLSQAIIYYDGNGNSKTYNAPQTADAATIDQAQIVTDSSQPLDARFVLITKNGDIYLAVPNENDDSVAYTRFKSPEKYDAVFQHTLCDITEGTVLCYRGYMHVGDYDTPTAPGTPTISTVQFGSLDMNTLPVSQKYLDTIHLTSDGNIYGLDNHTVYSFGTRDKEYTPTILAQSALYAASGKKLYILQDTGIYEIKDETLTQVFYSKNIKPKSLYISGDKVYILGKVADQSTMSAYLLNATTNTTPNQRLIDLFPASSTDIPDALTQDLVGTRAYVLLLQRQNLQADFEPTKDRVITNMQTLGIDTNSLDIKIAY